MNTRRSVNFSYPYSVALKFYPNANVVKVCEEWDKTNKTTTKKGGGGGGWGRRGIG